MAEEEESLSEWEQIPSPTHSTASSNNTTLTQHNQEQQHNSNSSSASSYDSSSDSEDHNTPTQVVNHVRVSFEALCTKVVSLVHTTRIFTSWKMGFGQFLSLSGVLLAVFASVMYIKMRRMVRRFKEREGQLFALINSKDENIRQLTVKLAHMDNLLSGRCKVPVIRIHQYSQSA